MLSTREIIILSALTLVKCQYEYYRPDTGNYRRANYFGGNFFAEEFGPENEGTAIDEIPGRAGTDFPVFAEIPDTGFRCDRQIYPGYYADPGTGCQVFHICQRGGRKDSFLCPNGTIFNQQWLVCD
ncbi:uncharacterized protein LOC110117352 [Athalia rosae]|uniref:uncharacterized protein LOC110117352 n=1 Tax=Athalia rosae TaxID=37344 RepID=UPI002033CE10|nr:uncharacterized protein LOC110117352 [Athalia rosae]